MNIKPSLCPLLLLAALLPLRAEPVKYPPINPALLYWTAMAAQTPLNGAQTEELTKMANGKIPPDEAKISFPFLNIDAEEMMRKAAQSPVPCDWGLPKENGPAVSLIYVIKMQELQKALLAKAELCFAQHRTTDGQDLLLDAHRMDRHTAAGEESWSWYVATIDDDLATRNAARHCLGWDEGTRRDHAAKLKALPPMPTLQESFRLEQATYTDWLERLLRTSGPQRQEQLEAAFKRIGCLPQDPAMMPQDPQENPARWDQPTWDRTQERYSAHQREAAAALGKPWKEGHAELDALAAAVEGEKFILYKNSMSILPDLAEKNFVSQTLRTMLDAALRYGAAITEADAANFHDAFEGEPLRLKKAEDGTLSLVAAGQHPKGKEIELKLGR